MSIRPVFFNGMIQSTGEVQTHEAEAAKQPQVQQDNIAVVAQRESFEAQAKVNEKPDASDEDESVKDEGQGNGTGYEGNRNRKKKEKEKVHLPDGSVRLKKEHGSFDLKI